MLAVGCWCWVLVLGAGCMMEQVYKGEGQFFVCCFCVILDSLLAVEALFGRV